MKQFALALVILGATPALALAQEDAGQTATPTVPTATNAANQQMASTGAGPGIFAHGAMGLSFAVPSGGGTTVGLRYFNDDKSAYDLLLGFHYAHTPDTTMGMPPVTIPGNDLVGFTLGFGYRMYQHHSAHIHTFLEPVVTISSTDLTNNLGSTFALGVGGFMGAEYMFADWISISGQIGLTLDFTQKFKQVNFDTTTSGIFANLYWN